MVSSTMLYQIDRKLQELKGSGRAFGGVSLLCFGDPCQLKPVFGNFIWQGPKIEEHSIRYSFQITLLCKYVLSSSEYKQLKSDLPGT